MVSKERKNINKYMFLFSVPIPVLVDIMLASARHIIFNCETYSISATQFSSQLGKKILETYSISATQFSSQLGRKILETYSMYFSN